MRRVIIGVLVIVLSSCASVEKFNAQLTKTHDPLQLKQDVDYVYHKLQRLHPDLYWYIPKRELDKKIFDLKKSLDKPLTSKEFYKKLAPVISNVRQGHISVSVPSKKLEKKERKLLGRRKSPFSSLVFESTKDQLFIKKNNKTDSTIVVGSEVLAVDNHKMSDLLADFKKLRSSDGYNKTFTHQFVGVGFGSFYDNVYQQKDSILLSLKKEDSLYVSYIYPTYSKINTASKLDTTKQKKTKQKLAKSERKLAKQQQKKKEAFNSKYGYDSESKEYHRNFKFLKSNDSTLFGYMNIKSFSKGKYEEFYKESFAKLDSAKCENFVLDLRGNLGGRLTEIEDLYSYLSLEEYVFVEKSKMTKRLSFLYPFFHTKSKMTKTLAAIFSPVLGVYQFFKVKKEDGNAYFKFKYSKMREPKLTSFKGKVYVLIDGVSFSASSILSTNLKATKRATFVGEETGGAYNGTVAGLFARLELPNSKINVSFGLMKLNAPHTITPDGYGIKPDILIEKTVNNVDEELTWIMNDIGR